MIDQKMILDEAWKAAMIAYHSSVKLGPDEAWKIALSTALNAWPDVKWHEPQVPDNSDEVRYMLRKVGIILPLSKEGK